MVEDTDPDQLVDIYSGLYCRAAGGLFYSAGGPPDQIFYVGPNHARPVPVCIVMFTVNA